MSLTWEDEKPRYDFDDPEEIIKHMGDSDFADEFLEYQKEQTIKNYPVIRASAEQQQKEQMIKNASLTREQAQRKQDENYLLNQKVNGESAVDVIQTLRAKEAMEAATAMTIANAQEDAKKYRSEKAASYWNYGPDPAEFLAKLAITEEGFQQYEFLVRGALLHCRCGSHNRRLNMPMDHGVYATDHPLIHRLDCLVGDDQNIGMFGICSSSKIPQGTKIRLDEYVPSDALGNPLGEPGKTLEGYPCTPDIIGTWLITRDYNCIVDNGLKDAYGKKNKLGQPAVTTASFLVCKYGGLIEPLNSGQDYLNINYQPIASVSANEIL